MDKLVRRRQRGAQLVHGILLKLCRVFEENGHGSRTSRVREKEDGQQRKYTSCNVAEAHQRGRPYCAKREEIGRSQEQGEMEAEIS